MPEPDMQIEPRYQIPRRNNTRPNEGGFAGMGRFRVAEIVVNGGREATRLRVDLRVRAARGYTATATRTTTTGKRGITKGGTHRERHSSGMGVRRVRGNGTRSGRLGRRRAHASNMDDATTRTTITRPQGPSGTTGAGSGAEKLTAGVTCVWATGGDRRRRNIPHSAGTREGGRTIHKGVRGTDGGSNSKTQGEDGAERENDQGEGRGNDLTGKSRAGKVAAHVRRGQRGG